jgi:hypothetical protein
MVTNYDVALPWISRKTVKLTEKNVVEERKAYILLFSTEKRVLARLAGAADLKRRSELTGHKIALRSETRIESNQS